MIRFAGRVTPPPFFFKWNRKTTLSRFYIWFIHDPDFRCVCRPFNTFYVVIVTYRVNATTTTLREKKWRWLIWTCRRLGWSSSFCWAKISACLSPIVCLGIIFRDRTVFKIIMCPFARTEMDDDNLFSLAQCVMIQTSLFKRAPFFLLLLDGWMDTCGCSHKNCAQCRLCHIRMIYEPSHPFDFYSFLFFIFSKKKVTGRSPTGPELATRDQPFGITLEMSHDDAQRWLHSSRHRRQTKYITSRSNFSFFIGSFLPISINLIHLKKKEKNVPLIKHFISPNVIVFTLFKYAKKRWRFVIVNRFPYSSCAELFPLDHHRIYQSIRNPFLVFVRLLSIIFCIFF